jgi:superfamily II DNA or RNA helicase
MELRPYQQQLVEDIYKSWESCKRTMTQLPTGGGKTIVLSKIADHFTKEGKRVLIIAHREELLDQASDKLAKITGIVPGVIKCGVKPENDKPIQVASIQSLVNRLEEVGEFGLVTIDEAHHSASPTYRKVLDHYTAKGAVQLGFTATPIRLDGKGFDDIFDDLVCGPTIRQLIDDGYLSPFKLYGWRTQMVTKGVKKQAGDYNVRDLARKNNAIELSGHLIESYLKYGNNGQNIVFAINVEHSISICEEYQKAGIPAEHLDGNTPTRTRLETIEKFRQGEIKVLVNCALFDEGFDVPAVEMVQIAKPTKSLTKWLQMCGRCLRPADGKVAKIVDHTNNWGIHGLPDRLRRWKLTGVETEPSEKLMINREGEVVTKEIKVVPIKELSEINEEESWWETYYQLIDTLEEKGYKPGWLYYQLKEQNPPLYIWEEYAKLAGYKRSWAKYQVQQPA